jgi:uncharacterized membrane-anchored protein
MKYSPTYFWLDLSEFVTGVVMVLAAVTSISKIKSRSKFAYTITLLSLGQGLSNIGQALNEAFKTQANVQSKYG